MAVGRMAERPEGRRPTAVTGWRTWGGNWWGCARWRVELGYRELKEELGLDYYEGRDWLG